ncbi:MAG: hypothetical protein H6823_11475 [Planctomycetaceae bacterium]|nr:hypothetical protein [Planctomycetaceae bacterium]
MPFRPLRQDERDLVSRLLAIEFLGRQQLLAQLTSATVEPIDLNGSLRFEVHEDTHADVSKRIPVEAHCLDSDDVCIHALLHVLNGRLSELEIYKDDSTPVVRAIDAEEWEIVVPY